MQWWARHPRRRLPVQRSRNALNALAALSQPTRLDVFRLLVKHQPEGLAAGDVAKALAVPANTLSAHLAVLTRAGLVPSQRYSDGRTEICAPLIADLTPCRPPKESVHG